MFYIVNENNDLVRSHPRWGSPEVVTTQFPQDYAIKFAEWKSAMQMLEAWERNNDFKGRVVTRTEAIEIGNCYSTGE